jgi:hypothetical protein
MQDATWTSSVLSPRNVATPAACSNGRPRSMLLSPQPRPVETVARGRCYCRHTVARTHCDGAVGPEAAAGSLVAVVGPSCAIDMLGSPRASIPAENVQALTPPETLASTPVMANWLCDPAGSKDIAMSRSVQVSGMSNVSSIRKELPLPWPLLEILYWRRAMPNLPTEIFMVVNTGIVRGAAGQGGGSLPYLGLRQNGYGSGYSMGG